MPEYLNQFLAERAGALVRDNFTGVRARWWWERRMGGGIEICPGLGDMEPVVLTFEIPGDTEAETAAEMLAERSSEPEGIAAGLYRRVEEALRG